MAEVLPSYIRDYGGSGQTIVLLHGFLASSFYWRRLQPNLSAAGYRVIAVDLLGFGRAPKPNHQLYTYREHLRHIEDALALLHLDEPFILVGHSMGALLALRFARQRIRQISSVILLHPPLYASVEQAYKVLRSSGPHYRYLLDSKFRGIGWGLLRFTLKMSHTKQSRELSLHKIVAAAEGLADLKKIQTHTLVLLGSKDRPEYIKNVEDAQLSTPVKVQIELTGHHSPLRHPLLITQRISDFSQV